MRTQPNDLIDPDLKGKDWVLQMAKYIWDDWNNNAINSFYGGRNRYEENEKYSLGKQDNAKYLKAFNTQEDSNESFATLDLTVVPVIPKFRRIVNERNGKVAFEVKADAIDPLALDDKKKYEGDTLGDIKVRELLQQSQYDDSMLKSDEMDQPQTEEELAIKMEFGYKHTDAIDTEKRIDAVFTASKIEDVRREIRRCLFDYGVCATKDWTDPTSGEVMFRYCNPKKMIVSYTDDPRFKDIWYVGEIITKTIDQIRNDDVENTLSEDSLEDLAYRFAGKYGNNKNYGSNSTYSKGYDSAKIPVMELTFLTVNRTVYEARVDKRGNEKFGRSSFKNHKKQSTDKKQYLVDDDLVWFETSWIMDSELVYNFGVISDQKKRPSQIWDSLSSFTIAAPEMKDMETTGMVDHIKPIADAIMIAWLKLQNAIAFAKPKGVMIEMGALEDVTLGEGGETFKPLELIDLFTQTGTLVYRKTGIDGVDRNYRPIEELNNGIGDEAARYFELIDRYFAFIRSITGFNEVTDGSAPDPRMLNGVAGLADASTNNAINHLLDAERSVVERLAESVAIRVTDSIVYRKSSFYDNILGAKGVEAMRNNKDSIQREFGIMLDIRGDDTERDNLKGDIDKAMAAGQITIADKTAVNNIKNTKQAELLLAFRVKKNLERMEAETEKREAANRESNENATRISEEEKRKTADLLTKGELAKIDAKKIADKELMELEFDLKKQEKLWDIAHPEEKTDSDKSPV